METWLWIFSNYRLVLDQLIYYHYHQDTSIKPYITWQNTTWVNNFNPFLKDICDSDENPFDRWFDQEIPNNNCNIHCLSGFQSHINHGLHYFNDIENLTIQQNIDKIYLKPKEHIVNKINDIYNSEFKDNVVLGIMARGSEYKYYHSCYGVKTIDDYIEEINKILILKPEINKIYIVSDETEYINKINSEFKNVYFLPNVFRRTDESDEYISIVHCWMNVSDKRSNHTKILGEECIIQTKLLGKCDYLLGIHSGIFAGAILWNENIKEIFLMK
jgi:hypothetical protein